VRKKTVLRVARTLSTVCTLLYVSLTDNLYKYIRFRQPRYLRHTDHVTLHQLLTDIKP